MNLQEIIADASLLISLLPAILIWLKKPRWQEVKYIIPFGLLTTFAGLYEILVTGIFGFNTTVWFKVYTFLEFVCIYYFFLKLSDKKYRKIFIFYLGVFIAIFVALQLYWINGGRASTDSSLTIFETVLVFSASFLWFRKIFSDMRLTTLWDSPAFYFISGFILYFSGTFFLFLMTDWVLTTEEMNRHWIINVILTLLLNSMITFGIWKGHQKSHQYSG
jgi:hypothetical protein